MAELVENRMAVDSEWPGYWGILEPERAEENRCGAGWEEIGTGNFVPEEEAYAYALKEISLDEGLKQEFVHWFFSGNWIKED